MKYGSVCSGIEAATVAWHPLGWEPQWFSEVEAFPKAVLAHHYPKVQDLGDMTTLHERKEYRDGSIDLLVGGTPCQSFSIAGLREGLADPRGNLALHFLKIVNTKRPRWVVWENVPGVLSSTSQEGSWEYRDFSTFLAGLRKLGYGFDFRILDAQYFGVPQRRRRIFVIGYLGDWRPASAVLFERQSLSGNPPPSRKTGKEVAGPIGGSSQSGGFRTTDLDNSGAFIVSAPDLNPAIKARDYKGVSSDGDGSPLIVLDDQGGSQMNVLTDGKVGAMRAHQHQHQHQPIVLYENHPNDSRIKEVDVCPQIDARAGTGGGNLPLVSIRTSNQGANGHGIASDVSHTMDANPNQAIVKGMMVRRLTPRECERLQGFPDDYTLIPWRKKKSPDGPRYKALGNSMAVPVMSWIGRRIDAVEKVVNEWKD